MNLPAGRRKKKPEAFEIVVVPVGDSGRTRKFTLSRGKMIFAGILVVGLCVTLTLAALTLTPLMRFLPIPDSVLEARYGRQVFDTQQQLKSLAEDVLVLRDYNLQLRKALGERVGSDSAANRNGSALQADGRRTEDVPASSPALPQASGDDMSTFDELDLVPLSNAATPPGEVRTVGLKDPSLPFIFPITGFITQTFDPAQGHFGMDVAGKKGTPVSAAGDGVVIFSGWTYEYGNMVIIAHGSGYVTVYKHNDMLLKGAPATVRRGEPIALLGASGRTSSGPHLHFEIWKDGVPQNPQHFLLTTAMNQ